MCDYIYLPTAEFGTDSGNDRGLTNKTGASGGRSGAIQADVNISTH